MEKRVQSSKSHRVALLSSKSLSQRNTFIYGYLIKNEYFLVDEISILQQKLAKQNEKQKNQMRSNKNKFGKIRHEHNEVKRLLEEQHSKIQSTSGYVHLKL